MTVPGGELVGAKLLPTLVALGRSHAELHASRVPAGAPPAAQPWWYSDLPCGT